MMKKYLYLTAIIILLFPSCEYDEMDRTIFVTDENDNNMPAYTEWGYNSFGAIYERSYFLVSNNIVPCKITYQSGMLNFYLIGKLKDNSYSYNYSGTDMVLTFSFPFSDIDDYTGLMELNNTVVDLTAPLCKVIIEIDKNKEELTPINGNLTFKRAQLLKIDGKENRVILSGVFDVSFLKDSRPETISGGRFDVGISNDYRYFYRFPDEILDE